MDNIGLNGALTKTCIWSTQPRRNKDQPGLQPSHSNQLGTTTWYIVTRARIYRVTQLPVIVHVVTWYLCCFYVHFSVKVCTLPCYSSCCSGVLSALCTGAPLLRFRFVAVSPAVRLGTDLLQQLTDKMQLHFA